MLSICFRRRDQPATVQAAREDLEQFVDSLDGMSDEEVGRVVAFAAVARVALRKSGVLLHSLSALITTEVRPLGPRNVTPASGCATAGAYRAADMGVPSAHADSFSALVNADSSAHRGLGFATATTAAAFFPHLEQRSPGPLPTVSQSGGRATA
jgi:hypothetical protein